MSNSNYTVGGRGKHHIGKLGNSLNKFVANAIRQAGPGRSKNFNIVGGNIRKFSNGLYNSVSIHLQNNGHAHALIRAIYRVLGQNAPKNLPVGIVTDRSGRNMMLISSKMFGIKNTNGVFVIKVNGMGLANYAKLSNYINSLVKTRRAAGKNK
jgi:putative lipoic acid-binding regulatory protein